MTDSPQQAGEDGAADELDALIGGLEAEAARRRAEPGFPLDAEARLGIELDRRAPHGAATPLAEVIGALVDMATRTADAEAAPGRRRGRDARQVDAESLSTLATAVSAAVLALARQVEQLEFRLARLESALTRQPEDETT